MSIYSCGATTDIGHDREKQEDFTTYKEFDDDSILAIIADGFGSTKDNLQPAVMAAYNIAEDVSYYYENNRTLYLSDVSFFLKKALLNANNVLGALKTANEEKFYGYGASITVAYFAADGNISVAHCGNTRMYVIRKSKLIQLTKDDTKAQELYDNGNIDLDTYHIHPDRLKLTSGVGVIHNPKISDFTLKMQDNDIYLLTTDGIHYALRNSAMLEIILNSENCVSASQELIRAAKSIIKYPDNGTCMLLAKQLN